MSDDLVKRAEQMMLEMQQLGYEVWPSIIRDLLADRRETALDMGQADERLDAAVKQAREDALRVKPLEWGPYGRSFCVADTIFGQAAVQNETTALSPNRWGWWAAGADEDNDPSGFADGIEAAKAAVQADYDARILSTLITKDTSK